ncbi:MAG: hypothetical protein NWQ28_10285 [Nodularia sp. (in: cyanobacteria)]|nr:hypothetical protein [Nodularia sp. (in: cyanobacteria)]
MADLKITNLKTDSEIIDLKAEAEKGNPEAIVAFKSLRGGLAACSWWKCCGCSNTSLSSFN